MTYIEKIDAILSDVSRRELEKFVRDRCILDLAMRENFLIRFEQLIAPISKELYANQLKSLIAAYEDRRGFINYDDGERLCSSIYELNELATHQIKIGGFFHAICISIAVLEEVVKVLNQIHQDVDIHTYIDKSFDILLAISKEQSLSEPFRKNLFDYSLRAYDDGYLDGWDWHEKMIELAIDLLINKTEADMILSRIDKFSSKYEYTIRLYQNMRLKLISKIESIS